MNSVFRLIGVLSAAAALALAPVLSHAEPKAKVLVDYTVFVDPPTGFVFVKLPAGWKFVGQIDMTTTSALPAHVVTALLTGDDDVNQSTRLASTR